MEQYKANWYIETRLLIEPSQLMQREYLYYRG